MNFYQNPFSKQTNIISAEIDTATINKDSRYAKFLLKKLSELLKTEDKISQISLNYSIGTIYSDFNFDGINQEIRYEKCIFYFRKSIKILESYIDTPDWKRLAPFSIVSYINYANVLKACGRIIQSIEYYEKALEFGPNVGMALGNLGIAYLKYAYYDYDDGHTNLLNFYAFQNLSNALEANDSITFPEAKQHFKKYIDYLFSAYKPEFFDSKIEFDKFAYEGKEKEYREWVTGKRLFLNTLNDLPLHISAIANDTLGLPNMTSKLDDKPIYHGMFNQIIQEFVYCRYTYFESLNYPNEPMFSDKETGLVFLTDYGIYSNRIEKLKSTYKTLYGLFDKIAYMLNKYYHLGLPNDRVYFKKIWYTKNDKNEKILNEKLDLNNNIFLCSLYWIKKDFFDKIDKSPNPELKKFHALRNSLEHRYTTVTAIEIDDSIKDGEAYYICEDKLYDMTLTLLKIVREAIISLSLSINIEERVRNTQTKGKVISIDMINYYDDLKL